MINIGKRRTKIGGGEQVMADLIDRQAAIDALMEILDRPNHAEFLYTDEICKALSAMPSAQPERKTGKWEAVEGWDGDVLYRCSECGTEFVLIEGTPEENDYHYCPHCGARMEEKLE